MLNLVITPPYVSAIHQKQHCPVLKTQHSRHAGARTFFREPRLIRPNPYIRATRGHLAVCTKESRKTAVFR